MIFKWQRAKGWSSRLVYRGDYRLLGRAGGAVIHVRSFLDRCGRIEREKREAKRPELERRIIRETGPSGTRETPFLAVPDYFDFVPHELRFRRHEQSLFRELQRPGDEADFAFAFVGGVAGIEGPMREDALRPGARFPPVAGGFGPSSDGPDRGRGSS